jgi:hypothetical protein
MAERLTDKVTGAITSMAAALRTYTRASQGLPMTMAKGVAIAVSTTQTITITAATDVWVNGIYTSITTAAAGAVMIDAKVTRMEISGFLIYENQDTAQNCHFFDTTGGWAGKGTPMNYRGLANPFVLRQGDVLSVTFQNGPTAGATASVMVDAYRCNRLSPG